MQIFWPRPEHRLGIRWHRPGLRLKYLWSRHALDKEDSRNKDFGAQLEIPLRSKTIPKISITTELELINLPQLELVLIMVVH